MPDGQDKSDDLIAELAKLMASNAGSSEPDVRPGPKLVSLPDASRPEGPTSAIRIPGMDAPVSASAPVNGQLATPAPIPPGVLRIPGMDQPASAAPAPAPTPVVTPSVAPVVAAPIAAKPAASFDFGTVPASPTFRPEPMSNWQDREIPRPVASRPVASVPAPAPKPVAVEPVVEDPMAELEAELGTGKHEAPRIEHAPARVGSAAPAAASPMVAAAKASPATDSFDFDFGFANEPPAPIPAPQPPQAKAPAAPASPSGDPIADLIAAELDTAEVEEAELHPVQAQPAPRSFPQPSAAPVARPQVNGVPSRGPAAQVQAAQPRPEDRFGVAPVFGPASKVQAPRASASQDPMDEIESLIGEAVRVELTTDKPAPGQVAAPVQQQNAPVVPPLTTGLPPRRAALKDTEPQIPSAEAAILAAAAASGAEVGRIDSMKAESPYKRVKAKPERRAGGMRQYVGMAVAGTLLLASGFGLYWVLNMGRGNDADAPVLQADATPVKETPPAVQAPAANQGSVVFNELDGNNAAAPTDEQLVSRDDTTETSVADVAQTVGDGTDATGESELANRKVRTVTVRPDGTIVSGDEAVAGNEELPVDRPAVPELPGADVQPSELLAAVPEATETDPIATAVATETAAVADPASVLADPLAATASAANIDPSIVAPVPVARPADRSQLGGGANQSVALSQPADQPIDLVQQQPVAVEAPAQPAAMSVAVGGSGPYVQLSSQPTQGDAQASLNTTQNRLSGLLAGRSLAIRQVDLGAKGIWYRVVLPVESFQEATQTCASLKASGFDCLPIGG